MQKKSETEGEWVREGQWRVGRNEGKMRERMIAQESGNQNPIKWNWKNHEAWSQGTWGTNRPMVSFNNPGLVWGGREEDVRIQGEQEKANGEYKKIEKWSVVVSSEVSDQQEDFEE